MTTESMTLAELLAKKGEEIGVSDWVTVGQERINGFADVTEDHQFIHVDEARAKAETPFGGTIAHGFLTLSLMVPMSDGALPEISDRKMGINYGLDKLRFLSPVPAGGRVRGRFSLDDYKERAPGQFMLTYSVTVDIEGGSKPALLATWLVMAIVNAEAA
jgi:acyl dehydratase